MCFFFLCYSSAEETVNISISDLNSTSTLRLNNTPSSTHSILQMLQPRQVVFLVSLVIQTF